MEMRFQIDDDLIRGLQQRTNETRASDLGRDGISLLNWATAEIEKGRTVASYDESGRMMRMPVMDVLSRAQY